LRCTGQNNQLTAINAHVGYVLFTVVMTTFTVAPSSGVPYADAPLAVYINCCITRKQPHSSDTVIIS